MDIRLTSRFTGPPTAAHLGLAASVLAVWRPVSFCDTLTARSARAQRIGPADEQLAPSPFPGVARAPPIMAMEPAALPGE